MNRIPDFDDNNFPKGLSPEEYQVYLDEAYSNGMLRKSELEDGKYYYGSCRNARVAVWSSKLEKFVYIRTKFGNSYPEDINHPEDDDGYDLFQPYGLIEPTSGELVNLEEYLRE